MTAVRMSLLVIGLLIILPGRASAQDPLAGLIARVIQSATFNQPVADGIRHEPHFLVGESLESTARQMNVSLGAQLLSFPLASSSGGFSFTTNPSTGEITPTSQTFGPTFAERAVTIGRGQFNLGFSFQATSYDAFEGVDLNSGGLSFYREHNDCCPPVRPDRTIAGDGLPAFERDLLRTDLNLEIDSRAAVVFGNYGVSDRFDIGFAIPFVHVDVNAAVDAQILRTATAGTLIHSFDAQGSDRVILTESGSANGLGDVLLRAKYNFSRTDTNAFAVALDLRLPTGDKDELLGTGATKAHTFFIYSGDFGRFSPHVNLGYTASNGDSSETAAALAVDPRVFQVNTVTDAGLEGFRVAPVDLSVPNEVNYAAGFSVAASPRVTLGFDFRGRTLLDVPRFELVDNVYPNRGPGNLPSASFTANAEFTQLAETGNMNLLLGVIGAKINVARTILLNASFLFPMGDDGLKPKPTVVVGLDYVF